MEIVGAIGRIVAGRCVRTVCVFTGSRADYGPMVPLLRRLRAGDGIDLRLLVSGGHLVPSQGLTIRAIEAEGFVIDECVDIVLSSDTSGAIAKSFGLACIGYADALRRIDADILVVLGDRYEALAAAVVALQQGIIVAHIGGGQLSYGSTDNQMRHAISKLAHVHFTMTLADSKRLMEMGEDATRIYQVGVIGLDSTITSSLMDASSLSAEVGIELMPPIFLVTYHPATADESSSRKGIDGLLGALEGFPNATVILTSPNVDKGSKEISDKLRKYAAAHKDRVIFVASLGQRRYLSLMKHAQVVIGNSSSGINEAALLGTPVVNIGTRQDGRSKPSSVIDCDEYPENIRNAISECMSASFHPELDERLELVDRSLDCMVNVLRNLDLEAVRKK